MENVDRLCREILATLWRQSPVNATYLGIHDHDGRLGEFDADALAAQRAELQAQRAAIQSLRKTDAQMSADHRLDLRLLEAELEMLVRTQDEIRPALRNPCIYLEEVTFGVYLLMLREFAPPEDRARSMLARLREVPRVLTEARRNLHAAEDVPRLWAEMARDLVASTCGFLDELPRWAQRFAPPLAGEMEEVVARARREVEAYLGFLDGHVLPRARGSFATGRAYFEFLLREIHGVAQGADDLERFGNEEIRATVSRLEELTRGAEPWQRQVERFKEDVPEVAGLLEAYRNELERSRRFVQERGLLDLPAPESLEVVETPLFERKTTPFAAYVPPAPFESAQKGYFWVTPPDPALSEPDRRLQMKEHMLASIPITCVHEAFPGHHVQLSAANRAASPVRRQIGTPVLIEGWALYCEEMMGEEGFYEDPRTRLLQLKDYLWRSCRVVIDVGLHTRGMGVEEASRILVDVAKINPVSALGEVKRYSKTPTQPLSYAVGKREILRLREEVQRQEGRSFSLSNFHRQLLRFGSLPPARIREQLFPSPHA